MVTKDKGKGKEVQAPQEAKDTAKAKDAAEAKDATVKAKEAEDKSKDAARPKMLLPPSLATKKTLLLVPKLCPRILFSLCSSSFVLAVCHCL